MSKEQYDVEKDYKMAQAALSWHGWGSPVGLGLALVSVGVFIWLLHLATIIK